MEELMNQIKQIQETEKRAYEAGYKKGFEDAKKKLICECERCESIWQDYLTEKVREEDEIASVAYDYN